MCTIALGSEGGGFWLIKTTTEQRLKKATRRPYVTFLRDI